MKPNWYLVFQTNMMQIFLKTQNFRSMVDAKEWRWVTRCFDPKKYYQELRRLLRQSTDSEIKLWMLWNLITILLAFSLFVNYAIQPVIRQKGPYAFQHRLSNGHTLYFINYPFTRVKNWKISDKVARLSQALLHS